MKTKRMTTIALCTAVVIVLSQLSIPMPYGVPMTLQTFAIPLVGVILGKRDGLIVGALYLLLGLIGLPVFAGMSGGAISFVGPTGGFLISFPLMAYLAGWGSDKNKTSYLYAGLILGAVANYAIGMFFFSFVTSSGLTTAFMACVAPFIPTSILKIVSVAFIGKKLKEIVVSKRFATY